ncbi:hypothetical protein [Saccharothrix sp. Mg75]|uniref:hypothetical protein n=1 Tax=Saccharothrix sp. Mg75 TaxID=3445357 RepID=UPI003EE992B6
MDHGEFRDPRLADADADPTAPAEVSIVREARVLRTRPARVALLLAALVNAATSATFAYLAVLATEVAHVPAGAFGGPLLAAAAHRDAPWVSAALAAVGGGRPGHHPDPVAAARLTGAVTPFRARSTGTRATTSSRAAARPRRR